MDTLAIVEYYCHYPLKCLFTNVYLQIRIQAKHQLNINYSKGLKSESRTILYYATSTLTSRSSLFKTLYRLKIEINVPINKLKYIFKPNLGY